MDGPVRTELHPDLQEAMSSSDIRSHHLSVEGARRIPQQSIEELGYLADPEPVETVTDYLIEGYQGGDVPIRSYAPGQQDTGPVLLWLHGGGWLRDSIDANDPICRTIANVSGATVVAVGYRLAPENSFPVGLEDCFAALSWVAENPALLGADPGRIAVSGKSAGGNLTVALALLSRDRDGPEIAHHLPSVPVLDRPRNSESYAENSPGAGLSREEMEWYWKHYLGDRIDEGNKYAAPLQARDLTGVPPATVYTAGFDPLRDDGFAYVERLRALNIQVTHRHYPDMGHNLTSTGFHVQDIGRTREVVTSIAERVQEVLA